MKPFSEMSIEERLAAKRERVIGKETLVKQWDDSLNRLVEVGRGTIVDVVHPALSPDVQELEARHGIVYGYVVRFADGHEDVYRRGALYGREPQQRDAERVEAVLALKAKVERLRYSPQ